MVCLLAVPCSVTTHDLLQFTAPCYAGILHFRIIRDASPNQYMVLIKFRSQVRMGWVGLGWVGLGRLG